MPDARRLLETVRDESYRLHVRALRALFRLEHGHTGPTKEAVDRQVAELARWQWAAQVAESMATTKEAEELCMTRVEKIRALWAVIWR